MITVTTVFPGPRARALCKAASELPVLPTVYSTTRPPTGFSRSGDVRGAARMFNVDEDDLTYEQAHRYMLSTRPLLFAPATNDTYSNHGLGVTGFLIEQLTGQTYPNYTENTVLNPLGLNYGRSWDAFGPLDARPHVIQSGNPVRCQCESSSLSTQAGGWTSSAGDLVRLMLATDQDAGHPDMLLGSTLDVMESAPFPSSTDRAHGWKRTNKGKLSHGGSTGGGRLGRGGVLKQPRRRSGT